MSQELELHGTLQLRSATLEDTEGLQTYCFPDQSVQEVTDHLTKDLEKSSEDDVYRIVAETGGHPIGQIRIERSVLENTTATIGDLKVLAPFRAFGVSTMLVEYAEKLAKDNGVQSLEQISPMKRHHQQWPCTKRILFLQQSTCPQTLHVGRLSIA